ncbi:hypothetical protein CPAV1605_568 [seawater metagenome]|uniref:Uncharacterized protein n=1 Tax=seawater metagenome TaxID=1561972 RepID=A0A5E8CHK3_9ZZZZ
MENNFDTKIEGIKSKLNYKYLTEIRKKLKEDESDYHLEELNKMIEDYSASKKAKQEEKNESESSEHAFSNLDQYMFKRPWNRLPEIHKLIKIKEYVNKSLIIYEKNNKEVLIKQMFKAIKEKKLTRKGSVNYDPVKGRIISIPSLKYDKNKETYFLVKS